MGNAYSRWVFYPPSPPTYAEHDGTVTFIRRAPEAAGGGPTVATEPLLWVGPTAHGVMLPAVYLHPAGWKGRRGEGEGLGSSDMDSDTGGGGGGGGSGGGGGGGGGMDAAYLRERMYGLRAVFHDSSADAATVASLLRRLETWMPPSTRQLYRETGASAARG